MSTPLNLWRRAEQLKQAANDPPKNSSEAWINRQSLQELYQNLLVSDLEFSLDKKVEQDLWNFAFKKQIVTLQNQCKDKQNQKRGEIQAGLNLFLDAASGFYIQLLQEICSIFGLDLPFRRKSRKLGISKEYQALVQKTRIPSKSSCLYLCQDCLVHLGDIARYKTSYDHSEIFYKHAAQLVPMNGQPYNQLAILEVQKGNRLSTIFYHTRSLAVHYPFPVAEINCNKFYARISKDGQESRQNVITNEWLSMFLQFLASIHLELDPMKSRIRLDRILLSFKPNVSSRGFNSQQLLHMVAILVYEYHSIIEKRLKNVGKGHLYQKPINKEVCGVTCQREDGDKNFGVIDDDDDDEEDEFAEHEGKKQRRSGILSGILLNEKELEEVYKRRMSMVLELAGNMLESLFMTANENEELRELLLPVIKIMLDWLTSNKDVINHAVILKSGLWVALCPLANSLVLELSKLGPYKNFIESYKTMPLPEDRELQCFLPLKLSHCHLSFTWRSVQNVKNIKERILRIYRVLLNCEAMEKLSSGILIAKYSSDSEKTLISLETNLSKNRPVSEVSTPNNVIADKRPSRLNVAIQTILQKSSDVCCEHKAEGDGESAAKQTKKSLKVEFKEVEDIWKENDSVENTSFQGDDKSEVMQNVDRNNNCPHLAYNFCNPPFHHPLHPPPCYGVPYRAPMYPLYPFPPPLPRPFAFRPGCPLPAPPSMIPRYNPITSFGISVTVSDSIISSKSEASRMKNSKEEIGITSNAESDFPCPPPQIMQSNKGPTSEVLLRQQIPTFQPMNFLPFPRLTLPNMERPLLPQKSLRSPYGDDGMKSFCKEQISQDKFSFFDNSYDDQGYQNFNCPHKGNTTTIPPKPSGKCSENRFKSGHFAHEAQKTLEPKCTSTNQNNASPCPLKANSNVINIFGAKFDNHYIAQPTPVSSKVQDVMQCGVGSANMTKPVFCQSQSDSCKPQPISLTNFSQPHQEHMQNENFFRPEKRSEGFFEKHLPHPDNLHSIPKASPALPSDWWTNMSSSISNMPENLQGFNVRLCGQTNSYGLSGSSNFSNCNNLPFEGKHVGSAVSYNLFNQSPWTPDLANDGNLSTNLPNIETIQKDQLARFGYSVDKHHVGNLLSTGMEGWNNFPPLTNQIQRGQISIMKSSGNDIAHGAAQQQNVATTTTWSGHPTPLEKLLQQQKQLKPDGN